MAKLVLSFSALVLGLGVLTGCESLSMSDGSMAEDAGHRSAVESFNARTWSNELDPMTF